MHNSSGKRILDGSTAFKLYDTYGFPLDLTQDYLRGYDWQVDVDGFDKAMLAQKKAARVARAGTSVTTEGKIFAEIADKDGGTEFLGYSLESLQSVVAYIISDNTEINKASQNDEVIIITNQTPFYAESGGQVGDVGNFSWQL